MSRFELRWAWRHPYQWLRRFWTHLALSAVLIGLSFVWSSETFSIAVTPAVWPVALTWVAALIFATSIAPFSKKLRAVTGASMVTLGTVRAAAVVQVLVSTDVTPPVLYALIFHDIILALVGVIWPEWTVACGGDATVEAGRDDRGTGSV